MLPTQLLVIDDEDSICYAFARYFEHRGMRVRTAGTLALGLEALAQHGADVLFLDVCLPDGSGLEALPKIQALAPATSVVVITAFGSLDVVAKAMQGRASEFLVKPLDLDEAAKVVEQILIARHEQQRLYAHPVVSTPAGLLATTGMVGCSAAMQQAYKRIGLVAQTEATVLIQGETGTGKELVARAIHDHSPRSQGPFVAVNCGALPDNLVESELFGYVRGAFTGADADKEGRLETADTGTLFLDELGELPLPAQVKLLRFLDSHVVERLGSVRQLRVNVRIVAATNRDLQQAVSGGGFRADLFYRLAVVQVHLPPLRERGDDVVLLARHFLAEHCGTELPALSRDVVSALRRYRWPGNVRELRNVMAHAAIVAAGAPVLCGHLPERILTSGGSGTAVDGAEPSLLLRQYLDSLGEEPGRQYERVIGAVEKLLFERALTRAQGNQSAAADWLGIHRNTLRSKLRDDKE